MNELAGQNLGGYRLEEEVGRGSMGVVYRGKQIALGREVAIKVLPQTLARNASYVARFIREAQIIAGLNHPNIVQIFDAGQQAKMLYFVMEYVSGPTLASLLHLDGTIPQHLAVEYVAQIADALDVAYRERHVIHRDIKPENLMLDRWGKIKVMDFGLARAIGHQRITVAKTLVGSIYYASPEQIWGKTLDNRSDIYALGVVLYEMVTGQRPFVGRSMPELTQAIISDTPRSPRIYNPALLPELEQIILTALSKDRHQRYKNASLMAEHLRTLNSKLPKPGTLSPGQHSRPKREHVVIHPPKRPQVQRPQYSEREFGPTHPPITGDPIMQPPPLPARHETQQFLQKIEGHTGPQEAVSGRNQRTNNQPPPLSSTLGSKEETAPLKSLQKNQSSRSLWEQLQKLFWPPSHS